MEELNETAREIFINKIREQAVDDFWTHERELIRNGFCTRNWTAEQIVQIMNLSELTGKPKEKGGIAYDTDGVAYYGHHMLNVSEHPEYAGDWRNIQALDHDEHYDGAHAGNNDDRSKIS